LAVGENQSSQSAKTFDSLVAMLLGSVLVNWCAWERGISGSDVLSLPNELLEQISLVLGQEQELGLINDITQISHQLSAFFRKSLVGLGESFGFERAVEGNVNLLVL
jgi:hypothetical protein